MTREETRAQEAAKEKTGKAIRTNADKIKSEYTDQFKLARECGAISRDSKANQR